MTSVRNFMPERVRGHSVVLWLRWWTALILWLPAALWAARPADPTLDFPLPTSPMRGARPEDMRAPGIFRPAEVLARNLQSPDGLALDTSTGNLYVSEEDVARISRILPDGTLERLFDASTPLYEERDGRQVQVVGLRSPEGVALDGKGTLYVVEDTPGGRLIAFDISNIPSRSFRTGRVVPLPQTRGRYAWESVAVGPEGDLLIAGSTLESFGRGPEDDMLFRGAILYRDSSGEWWMPLDDAMASYSAACFSPDGTLAYFACEATGVLGVLDLRPRVLRVWYSQHTFRSPEGLWAHPGGTVLVAEEGGRLYAWDPTTDRVRLLYDHEKTIESVLWDAQNRRMLLTDDQTGRVISLTLRRGLELDPARADIRLLPFAESARPMDMIPDECPTYLEDILKLAGYVPENQGGRLSFRDFARRYCLIAIDAETRLLMTGGSAVEDPITRIQFVVVAPYLVGYLDGELIWSASGFTVIKQSGEMVKTELLKRQVIQGDLLERRAHSMGTHQIALPIPFSARMDGEGLVSVNFLGMGVMDDYYLVLDSEEPNDSVMVVIQPDGLVHQYQIVLPRGRQRTHWVVALDRPGPMAWRRMTVP